jgi:acyl dehydratase
MRKMEVELLFTTKDILDYVLVSGDDNPIHTDEGEARKMGFASCPVHGMLVMGRVAGYCKRLLNGTDHAFCDFSVRFRAPVYVNTPYLLEVQLQQENTLNFSLRTQDLTALTGNFSWASR